MHGPIEIGQGVRGKTNIRSSKRTDCKIPSSLLSAASPSPEITSCHNDIGLTLLFGIHNPSSGAHSHRKKGKGGKTIPEHISPSVLISGQARPSTCRDLPTIPFLPLWPITKIIVSSTLSKLKWKEGKAKWCRRKSRGWDRKRGTR